MHAGMVVDLWCVSVCTCMPSRESHASWWHALEALSPAAGRARSTHMAAITVQNLGHQMLEGRGVEGGWRCGYLVCGGGGVRGGA